MYVRYSCGDIIPNLVIGQCPNLSIDKTINYGEQYGMAVKRAEQVPDNMRPEAIGMRLTMIREAFGYSKSEFADMLDIGRTPWSRFELGQRAIPYDKAYKIVQKFGVSLDFIILGRTSGLTVETLERLRSVGLDR